MPRVAFDTHQLRAIDAQGAYIYTRDQRPGVPGGGVSDQPHPTQSHSHTKPSRPQTTPSTSVTPHTPKRTGVIVITLRPPWTTREYEKWWRASLDSLSHNHAHYTWPIRECRTAQQDPQGDTPTYICTDSIPATLHTTIYDQNGTNFIRIHLITKWPPSSCHQQIFTKDPRLCSQFAARSLAPPLNRVQMTCQRPRLLPPNRRATPPTQLQMTSEYTLLLPPTINRAATHSSELKNNELEKTTVN